VNGVGERKLQLFGERFLTEIIRHTGGNPDGAIIPEGPARMPRSAVKTGATQPRRAAPAAPETKVPTALQTLELYQQGLSVDEIATARELTGWTITQHLISLKQGGYDIDLNVLVTPEQRADIEPALRLIGVENNSFKPVFEHLEARHDYNAIRVVWALMNT
jgi:ATP-dependent DNA helicase RecQ